MEGQCLSLDILVNIYKLFKPQISIMNVTLLYTCKRISIYIYIYNYHTEF